MHQIQPLCSLKTRRIDTKRQLLIRIRIWTTSPGLK